jgi:hypothetical protein
VTTQQIIAAAKADKDAPFAAVDSLARSVRQ